MFPSVSSYTYTLREQDCSYTIKKNSNGFQCKDVSVISTLARSKNLLIAELQRKRSLIPKKVH